MRRGEDAAAAMAAQQRPATIERAKEWASGPDLVRFYQSVGERRWFLRHFPDLVRPLPCLMPLYGRGRKRPGAAARLRHLLGWDEETLPAAAGPAQRVGTGVSPR
jgi:hypothetical protein